MGKIIDLTGKVFGRLTVLRRSMEDAKWVVQCSCGSLPCRVAGSSLRNGLTRSCGCLMREYQDSLRRVNSISRTPVDDLIDELGGYDA